ncbi:MAG: hypothetical protein CM15mP29_3610 [Alphaproteobacteria bacterium]|nr:MAG: hypothetical protein CM15mP29_3610 [Alphaproteobacteria bacterium]
MIINLRSIKSIINFDDTNEVEIVLIDGGSKESLKNNIKRNLRESDQFIYEKDGIFDAINKRIKFSKEKLSDGLAQMIFFFQIS